MARARHKTADGHASPAPSSVLSDGQPASECVGIVEPNCHGWTKRMRLYDFGILILAAGVAAAIALIVASQVG